jgi:DNA repair photolyase
MEDNGSQLLLETRAPLSLQDITVLSELGKPSHLG